MCENDTGIVFSRKLMEDMSEFFESKHGQRKLIGLGLLFNHKSERKMDIHYKH